MRNRIIDLTKKLVSYKSVAGQEMEKQGVLDFTEKWFRERGFEVEKFDHDKHPSVIVNFPGQGERNVLFMAHLDVVSAPDDLFNLKIVGEKLLGRGVLDNKGMAAMLMLLAEKLKASGKSLPNLHFMFTTDEEIGGEDGAKKLSQLERLKMIDFIIVPDGGDHNRIVYKEKGIIQLHLEIIGQSAHAARPWLSNNPIEKALVIYQKINNLFVDEDLLDEKHWHPTASLTRLIAGQEINKIPDRAELGIDIRFTENYSPEDLLQKIESCFDESVLVKKIKVTPCLVSHESHEHIDKYKKAMEEVLQTEIAVVGEHGASDAQYFQYLNVPIILHRPAGDGLHSDHENMDLNSAEKFIVGWEKFLENF